MQCPKHPDSPVIRGEYDDWICVEDGCDFEGAESAISPQVARVAKAFAELPAKSDKCRCGCALTRPEETTSGLCASCQWEVRRKRRSPKTKGPSK